MERVGTLEVDGEGEESEEVGTLVEDGERGGE